MNVLVRAPRKPLVLVKAWAKKRKGFKDEDGNPRDGTLDELLKEGWQPLKTTSKGHASGIGGDASYFREGELRILMKASLDPRFKNLTPGSDNHKFVMSMQSQAKAASALRHRRRIAQGKRQIFDVQSGDWIEPPKDTKTKKKKAAPKEKKEFDWAEGGEEPHADEPETDFFDDAGGAAAGQTSLTDFFGGGSEGDLPPKEPMDQAMDTLGGGEDACASCGAPKPTGVSASFCHACGEKHG